jgi:hypothetical protein
MRQSLMAARRDGMVRSIIVSGGVGYQTVVTLPDIGVWITTWLTDLYLLIARPASMRIFAAFLGAACKIRFFEIWPGAANSAAA